MTPAQFKNIRAALGLSQSQMARALRVTRRTVQGWEAGAKIPGIAQVAIRCVRDHATKKPAEAG